MNEPEFDAAVAQSGRTFARGIVIFIGGLILILLGFYMGKGKLPWTPATPAVTVCECPGWKMTADHCAIYNIADPAVKGGP